MRSQQVSSPTTYVINLDSEIERWTSIKEHLEGFELPVERWSATTPEGIVVRSWTKRYSVSDPERRIAILRSYRSLFSYLEKTNEDEWLIVQDDIRFLEHPDRDSKAPIHLYGGYTHKDISGGLRVVNPTKARHVCPRAFRLKRSVLRPLRETWNDETMSSCRSWTPLLRADSTSFDDPPTLEGEIP